MGLRVLIRHEGAPLEFIARLRNTLEVAAQALERRINVVTESTLPRPVGDFKSFAGDTFATLLVAATEDIDSGWLSTQNLTLKASQRSAITVFLGEADADIQTAFGAICFGQSTDHNRSALGALTDALGLQGLPDGWAEEQLASLASERYLVTDPPDSEISEPVFYDKLFTRLNTNPAQILLTQDGRGERNFVRQIREQATRRYSPRRVLAIKPPSSLDVTLAEYFAILGEECGFEGVERQFDWERCLKDRIEQEGLVFLLISRFEHGNEDCQKALAKVLRGVSEEVDRGQFLVVVSGGVDLAKQKYVDDEHSFLNHADASLYPDLTARDLIHWVRTEYFSPPLSEATAEALIQRYGAHPGLLRQALGVLRRLETSSTGSTLDAIRREERRDRWFEPHFVPFRRTVDEARQVCRLLTEPRSLGQFSLWPGDLTVHRLFWKNLITSVEGRFCWRSDKFRRAGVEILGCEHAP